MLDRSVQILAIAGGSLMLLGGFALAVSLDPADGIMALLIGTALVVAAILQRTRYRSLTAERLGQQPGPGGGEDRPLEPRFGPTPELFVDPTTGRLMRVYIDPRSGERRYVAEG